eukprot:TRINITY_DN13375_c0_g1_i1.p2 TRINITY_DN13375_c0_g1~~TRINITY_DN13375_c0_g1_i1.p2  ORF type:complete len:577 (+),score=62.55 TRINITY_DN13375_c0_g1_i1:2119-3849(+)
MLNCLLSSLNGEHLSKVDSLEIDVNFSGLPGMLLPWFASVLPHVRRLNMSFAADFPGNIEDLVTERWNCNLIESLTLRLGRPQVRRALGSTTWPKLKYLCVIGATPWEDCPTPPTAPNLEYLRYDGLFRDADAKTILPIYPELKQLDLPTGGFVRYDTFAEECMDLYGLPVDKVSIRGVPGWEIAYDRKEVGLRSIVEAEFADHASSFLQSLQRICNNAFIDRRLDALPTLATTLKRLIAAYQFHVDPVLIECVALVSILAEKAESPENSLREEFEKLLDFAACPLTSLASLLMGHSASHATLEIARNIDCALFVRDNSGRHPNLAAIVISLLASIVSKAGVDLVPKDSIKSLASLALHPSFITLPKRDSTGATVYPSAVFILDLIEEFESNTTWLELLPFLRKAASQGATSVGKGTFLAAAMMKSPDDPPEVKEAKVLYVCSYQATMLLAGEHDIAGKIFDCDGSYSRIFALQDIWNQRFGPKDPQKDVCKYHNMRESVVALIFESALRTGARHRICRAVCDTVDFPLPQHMKIRTSLPWNRVKNTVDEMFASSTCKLSQAQRTIVLDRLKGYFT